MKVDTNKFRKALGKFTTGITIVTTLDKNQNPRGFTANSFTSVSLNPPLILICIGEFNESLDLFNNSEFFAVNILNENQKEMSNTFASPSKSRIRNLQSIGRTLRKHDSKARAYLYDFADDISNEYNRNMTLNHMVFRIKTYNDEKFDYSITEINLRK